VAAGQAAVPHRREEPASYRPTATAKKHGPLQSRAGRQIRDVGWGYALPFVTPPETVLILIDARFSPCSPRSTSSTGAIAITMLWTRSSGRKPGPNTAYPLRMPPTNRRPNRRNYSIDNASGNFRHPVGL